MFVQLLKTTPYLSGQHRLDVCLKKTIQDLKTMTEKVSSKLWYVTTGECHLAPLSDGIVFNDSISRPFFSQTYGDNLKQLYSQIKDDFFRDVPSIKTQNILYEDDIWVDTTDHTYECGLKRLRYKKYNKQFSWLCPIWIENATDLNSLYFIMTVYGDKAKEHSMKFKINLAEELKKSLKEWLFGISSDLLYIDIKKEKATITGARADSGTPVTADVSYIVPQLIERERPVMETNSTLNQLFSSNHMIARQLINFNFCFSPEDVIPSHVIKEMIGKRWKVTVEAYNDGSALPIVDFLSNYEFVPAYKIDNNGGGYTNKINVLDYLEDNKYIDYMYINKTTQVDPYWALVENPDCIYNFYNGFSSWYEYKTDQNKTISKQILGLSQNQPDTSHREYSYKYNNIGWCTVYDYSGTKGCIGNDSTYQFLKTLIESIYNNSKKATDVVLKSKKVCWVGGLKFDLTDVPQGIDTKFKILICLTGDDLSKKMHVSEFYHNYQQVICLFVPTNKGKNTYYTDMLTVKNLTMMSPTMNDFTGTSGLKDKVLTLFEQAFPHLVFPEKIFFNKSIQAVPAESPFDGSKEVTYIKQEYNIDNYVYRYSGALRPCFISPKDQNFFNIDYYYKKWIKKEIETTNVNSEKYKSLVEYNKMLNTNYTPVFPSVGYYALEKGKNSNEIGPQANRIDYFSYPIRYEENRCEFQWYMDGRFYVLPNQIEIEFIESQNVDESYIKNKLRNELYSKICSNIDTKGILQLIDLYDYTIDYDYISPTDIKNQKFKVKYILR